MPNLVYLGKIGYHAGDDDLIQPFVKTILSDHDLWQGIIVRDNSDQILKELSDVIGSIPESELIAAGVNKQIAVSALNNLNGRSNYFLSTQLYRCTLDDHSTHKISYKQILAATYKLLIKGKTGVALKEAKQRAAKLFASILQNQACAGGRSNTCIEHYNYATSVTQRFEPLTEDQAKQMFDVLVERSQTFFSGIVPKPVDDITVDDTDPHKTLFSMQDAKKHDYIISHTETFGEQASLKTTYGSPYLQLSQKYFQTNIFAELFSTIVTRNQNIHQPLTMHSIIIELLEIDKESTTEEVDKIFPVIEAEVRLLLLQEKSFLQTRLYTITPKELGIILLAEAIVYAGLSRNIREFLDRIDDQEKKDLFGLQDDNDLLTANNLAEDLRLLNVRLYEVIPTLLSIPDGSIKVMGGGIGLLSGDNGGYKENHELRSSKEFLQICWALLNESVSEGNANKERMRTIVIDTDEDGEDVTLGEVITNTDDPDLHFGILSPTDRKAADRVLQSFRLWIVSNKQGACPCLLHSSEIDQLERWGAAALAQTTNHNNEIVGGVGVTSAIAAAIVVAATKAREIKELAKAEFYKAVTDKVNEFREARTIEALEKIDKTELERFKLELVKKYPELEDVLTQVLAKLNKIQIRLHEEILKEIEKAKQQFNNAIAIKLKELEKAKTIKDIDAINEDELILLKSTLIEQYPGVEITLNESLEEFYKTKTDARDKKLQILIEVTERFEKEVSAQLKELTNAKTVHGINEITINKLVEQLIEQYPERNSTFEIGLQTIDNAKIIARDRVTLETEEAIAKFKKAVIDKITQFREVRTVEDFTNIDTNELKQLKSELVKQYPGEEDVLFRILFILNKAQTKSKNKILENIEKAKQRFNNAIAVKHTELEKAKTIEDIDTINADELISLKSTLIEQCPDVEIPLNESLEEFYKTKTAARNKRLQILIEVTEMFEKEVLAQLKELTNAKTVHGINEITINQLVKRLIEQYPERKSTFETGLQTIDNAKIAATSKRIIINQRAESIFDEAVKAKYTKLEKARTIEDINKVTTRDLVILNINLTRTYPDVKSTLAESLQKFKDAKTAKIKDANNNIQESPTQVGRLSRRH